jgi:hypothetical protein
MYLSLGLTLGTFPSIFPSIIFFTNSLSLKVWPIQLVLLLSMVFHNVRSSSILLYTSSFPQSTGIEKPHVWRTYRTSHMKLFHPSLQSETQLRVGDDAGCEGRLAPALRFRPQASPLVDREMTP